MSGAARKRTTSLAAESGVEHARARGWTGCGCATARCPSATSRASRATHAARRARSRAAGRLGDDGRDGEAADVNAGSPPAAEHGLAMALGSGRALLEDPALLRPTRRARDRRCCWRTSAPAQVPAAGPRAAERLVDLLGADGCRPPQPDPGGGPARGRARFAGVLERIAAAGRGSRRAPVVVKEVGFGMDGADVALLRDAGVAAVDVAGAGGTNWALVEGRRDRAPARSPAHSRTGACRRPRAAAARAAAPGLPSIASGGLRDGVDAAKCLALGAAAPGSRGRSDRRAGRPGRRGLGALLRQLRIATWAGGAPRRTRSARSTGMRVVVIGAGLGGLGARAAPAGRRATRSSCSSSATRPGGRAGQLRDAGFTWDTGPSLITMPWVLEETFAAAGLDLHAEVDARRSTLLPHPLGGRASDTGLRRRPRRGCAEEIAQLLGARRRRLRRLPRRAEADLRAGRSSAPAGGRSWRRRPRALRAAHAAPRRGAAAAPLRRAATSSTRACARRSPSTRCSSAATRSACRRSTPRSSTSSSLDGVWYADGGVYAVVEAMARRARRPLRRAGRADRVRAAGASPASDRAAASDRRRRRRVQRRRAAHARAARPPRAAAAPAADDVLLPALPRAPTGRSSGFATTRCWSGAATGASSATSRAAGGCRRRSRPTSTRRRGRSPRWRRRWRPLCVLLPVPNLRAEVDWAGRPTGCATR